MHPIPAMRAQLIHAKIQADLEKKGKKEWAKLKVAVAADARFHHKHKHKIIGGAFLTVIVVVAIILASQTMPRTLRAVLVGGSHFDIDMINAHFAILADWAQTILPDKSFPFLMQYVGERKPLLELVMAEHSSEYYVVTRDDAKDLFITVLYRKQITQALSSIES